MGNIISYKDALEYRDVYVQSKVNMERNQDIVNKTKQVIRENNNTPRMTKQKEFQSDIGFWL